MSTQNKDNQANTYTKAFYEEYKGNPVIGIWETDDNGNKTQKYPIISFGINKANAIMTHQEEIEGFLQRNIKK